jgi:hypothetical protein
LYILSNFDINIAMKLVCLIITLLFSAFLNAQIITTIAGNGNPGFSGEGGPAINAEFYGVNGVAVDKYGNIYIADRITNVVEKIDTYGILTRFAGTGALGSGGDNGPATSAHLYLDLTVGLAVDTIGNVYISSGQTIRKVNTVGIISTVVGNGSYGYSGDGGPATAAEIESPSGLCFDKAGNLYIADYGNSNIRMVNTAGIISTIAGTTIGFSGDGGPATNAQMNTPEGITVDGSGNMYIADLYTARVRKINSAGIINTIAGGDSIGITVCTGCHATSLLLDGPIGVAVDHSGDIYTSVNTDNVVQKITQSGLAFTIVGNGTAGYSGDGGPASNAMLNAPEMLCLDNSGNLLITDPGNHRLRKVWLGTNYVPSVHKLVQFSVYPNPITNHNFTCKITTDTNEETTLIIRNVVGQKVFTTTCPTNTATNFSMNAPPGIYFITATTKESKINKKLVVE